MPGMIEKIARTPMLLKRRAAIVDGKPTYTETPCLGMEFDFSQADLNYFGTISGGTVVSGKSILLAPVEGVVDTSCLIAIGGKDQVIRAVKTIRNLRGVLLGYKLAV